MLVSTASKMDGLAESGEQAGKKAGTTKVTWSLYNSAIIKLGVLSGNFNI